jgi:hypothetical protein
MIQEFVSEPTNFQIVRPPDLADIDALSNCQQEMIQKQSKLINPHHISQ